MLIIKGTELNMKNKTLEEKKKKKHRKWPFPTAPPASLRDNPCSFTQGCVRWKKPWQGAELWGPHGPDPNPSSGPCAPSGQARSCPNPTQNLSPRRGIDPETLACSLLNFLNPPSVMICWRDIYIRVFKSLKAFPVLFFFFFPLLQPPAFCFIAPRCRGCDAL